MFTDSKPVGLDLRDPSAWADSDGFDRDAIDLAIEKGDEFNHGVSKPGDDIREQMAEMNALIAYRDKAYAGMNAYLRGQPKVTLDGMTFDTAAFAADAARVQRLVARAGALPEPFHVYRGIGYQTMAEVDAARAAFDAKVGQTFTLQGMVSTTYAPSFVKLFAVENRHYPLVFRIKARTGLAGFNESESAFQPQTFMPPPGTVNHFWWNGRMDILWAPWAIERLPECCIPCYVALEARTNTSHYRVSYRIQTCFPWNMDNQIGWAARLDQAVAYAYSTVTVAAIEFLTRDEQGLQQALLQPGRRLHVPNQGERSSLTNISRMHLRFILQRRTMQNTLTTRVSNAVTFDSAGQNFEFITRLRGRRPLLTFAVEQGQYESELRREINLYDRILDMTDYSEVPQDDYEARYESAARQMFQTGAWNANTRLLVKERGDEPFFDQSDAQDEDVPFDWNLRGVLITFEDRNAIGYGLRMAGEPYTVPSQQFIGNYLANLRDGPELPWDAVIVLDEGEGDDVARVVIPERTYDMEQMQTVIHEFDQYWDTD
jgi:hypothetical protein